MRSIPAHLRRLVIARAHNCCEYCGLSQIGQAATFHIDHIAPVVSGGQTISENLALACVSCSLRKSARETVFDTETGLEVPIFHPRQQHWSSHFRWEGVRIVGLTLTGRAMIAALDLNRSVILAIRNEEAFFQRHPPQHQSR